MTHATFAAHLVYAACCNSLAASRALQKPGEELAPSDEQRVDRLGLIADLAHASARLNGEQGGSITVSAEDLQLINGHWPKQPAGC